MKTLNRIFTDAVVDQFRKFFYFNDYFDERNKTYIKVFSEVSHKITLFGFPLCAFYHGKWYPGNEATAMYEDYWDYSYTNMVNIYVKYIYTEGVYNGRKN